MSAPLQLLTHSLQSFAIKSLKSPNLCKVTVKNGGVNYLGHMLLKILNKRGIMDGNREFPIE